ncbi:hypothetical protein HDV62DRAFT_121354 [Trichoderma sp. SZMC 28011]
MAAAAAGRGGASRSRTAGPSRAQIMVTDLKSYMTCHSLRLAFGKIKHGRHDDPQLQSLAGFALWSICRRTFEDAHSRLCTLSPCQYYRYSYRYGVPMPTLPPPDPYRLLRLPIENPVLPSLCSVLQGIWSIIPRHSRREPRPIINGYMIGEAGERDREKESFLREKQIKHCCTSLHSYVDSSHFQLDHPTLRFVGVTRQQGARGMQQQLKLHSTATIEKATAHRYTTD